MAEAPVGERAFGDPLSFGDIGNRNPIESLRTHNRVDPYWGGLWDRSTAAGWQTFRRAQRMIASTSMRMPDYMDADPELSCEAVVNRRNRERTLDALGVLDNWRTVTAEQLAAFASRTLIASGRSTQMREMFGASLVDIGEFANGLLSRSNEGARLYRPTPGDAFEKVVRPSITYPEWVSVTCGTPYSTGRQFDKHNVIASEFALRVAEFTDAALVLGEKMATHELLAYTSIGRDLPDRLFQRSGDLVIVREDGARIVIEVTTSRGAALGEKIDRWAQILGDRRMSRSGLSVIFLTVDVPDTPKARSFSLRNGVMRYLRSSVAKFPGVSFDRTAERIGVADWREWFPEPGKVSPDFLALVCDVANGEPASPWSRKAFLDIFDLEFSPEEPERFSAIFDNASMLRSVPKWMRTGTAPDLTGVMHARSEYAGMDLRSLQRERNENQERWFSAPVPPRRLRSNGPTMMYPKETTHV